MEKLNNNVSFDNVEVWKEVVAKGRVIFVRNHKHWLFADLLVNWQKIQIFVSKDKKIEWFKRGAIISCKWIIFLTKTEQKTINVDSIDILAVWSKNIPKSKNWNKPNNQYERLLVSQNYKEIFLLKQKIISQLRTILLSKGYQEVSTPTLVNCVGSSLSTPFITQWKFTDKQLYLRKTLELNLKKLLIVWFDKIFEIWTVFTNEWYDKNHLPERIVAEWVKAYSTIEDIIDEIKSILEAIYQQNNQKLVLEKISFEDFIKESYKIIFGWIKIDITKIADYIQLAKHKIKNMEQEEIFAMFYKKIPLNKVNNWNLIIHTYPTILAPLAKKINDSNYTKDFSVFVRWQSIAHGCEDENNAVKLKKSLKKQLKVIGKRPYRKIDEELIELLEYGAPPSASWWIGIERILQQLIDEDDIRKLTLFGK